MNATKLSISLYPAHLQVIDRYAATLEKRGKRKHYLRSTAVQKIIGEWAEARGERIVTSVTGRPIAMSAAILAIGYLHLKEFVSALDRTQPVYVAPYIETTYGSVQSQHTDHHYILVMQPDTLNRVHYCRIPVVKLVYHQGIAFAPDYQEHLAKVEQFLSEVEAQLAGGGYEVRKGLLALPTELNLLNGALE